jgi:hypothetical protein
MSGKNPTSITVVPPPLKLNTATSFGLVNIYDDPLTLGPELSSKIVGKAQGFYASASKDDFSLLMAMNFAFIEGEYNESTITIMGRNSALNKVREMPIVGGSGLFRFARGYAQTSTYQYAHIKSEDTIVEYNVYVFHYWYLITYCCCPCYVYFRICVCAIFYNMSRVYWCKIWLLSFIICGNCSHLI